MSAVGWATVHWSRLDQVVLVNFEATRLLELLSAFVYPLVGDPLGAD